MEINEIFEELKKLFDARLRQDLKDIDDNLIRLFPEIGDLPLELQEPFKRHLKKTAHDKYKNDINYLTGVEKTLELTLEKSWWSLENMKNSLDGKKLT